MEALGFRGSSVFATVVERTFLGAGAPGVGAAAAGGTLILPVEDEGGTGNTYRTFELTLSATTTLELAQPAVSPTNTNTNSVTLIIHQDGTGGWNAPITISGGGIIHWDNSASQPPLQTIAGKTTMYVLVNVNNTPLNVWYGSRAVFEI